MSTPHGGQGRAFHDPDEREQFAVLALGHLAQGEQVRDDGVIQPGGAGQADAPLGTELAEEACGVPVFRVDVDFFRRVGDVFQREAEGGELGLAGAAVARVEGGGDLL